MFPQAARPGPGRRKHRRAASRVSTSTASSAARFWSSRGSVTAAPQVQGRSLHPDEGRGWPSHAVLHQLPSAVLLPHDGLTGIVTLPEARKMVMPGDNVTVDGRADRCRSRWKKAALRIREGGRTLGAASSPPSSSNPVGPDFEPRGQRGVFLFGRLPIKRF